MQGGRGKIGQAMGTFEIEKLKLCANRGRFEIGKGKLQITKSAVG